MPHDFGKFRYNFSSYLLVLRVYCGECKESSDRLAAIRGFNLWLFILGFVGLLGCVLALNFSKLAGAIVLLIYSLSPGNIHDAHMARPETFLSTLTILYLLLCIFYFNVGAYFFVLAAAFILGFAIATKFTFAILLALIMAFVFLREADGIFNLNLLKKTFGILVFLFFGFSLGAPYALMDLQGYIDGVNQLQSQYYNLHLPHSYVGGGSTWLWQLEFFLKIYGLIMVMPVILIIYSIKNKILSIEFYFAVCALLFICIFCRASVFFERNINPIIPLFALLAGFVVNRATFKKINMILIAVIIIPLAYWSYWIYAVQLKKYSLEIDKIEYGLRERYKPSRVVHQTMSGDVSGCGLIRFVDFSDQTSKESRKNLIANDWENISNFNGPFQWLPTSTLHTYLSANIFWYFKNCNNELKEVER